MQLALQANVRRTWHACLVMLSRPRCLCVAGLLAVGCGDAAHEGTESDSSAELDAGGSDSGVDSSPDSSSDIGMDLGPEATTLDADASGSDAPDGDGGTGIVCGLPPWALIDLRVLDEDLKKLAGVMATISSCPGVVGTTSALGRVAFSVSRATPFTVRLEQLGHLTLLLPEFSLTADSSPEVVLLRASAATWIAGWSSSKAAILASADYSGSGACAARDGVSFVLAEKPTLSFTYYASGTPPVAMSASTTTSFGVATAAGLDGGSFVTITGSKTGCKVDLARPPFTGRLLLEASALTRAVGTVSP